MGDSNNGNTLPSIFQKASQKVSPSCGSTKGKTSGTITAPKRLENKV